MDTKKPQHYSQNRSFQHSFGVEVLQRYLQWEEGDTVLDAGCGTGEICKYISQQPGVASVVGFDLSHDFISYASKHNSSPNVLYHVADASDVTTIKPEWRGAFSKLVSIFVLNWIQDKAATLNLLHSCLKPQGELLLVCPTEQGPFYQVNLGMASHPKWRMHLKDFVPTLLPWPSSDLTTNQSSRLLEECGLGDITCYIKKHQQPYDSKDKLRETVRSVLPHMRLIPQFKHEEFLDDVEKMAEEQPCPWISVESVPTLTDDILIVHARKQ
ncbi:Hypp41 [Branchiostoma lanceolatum]|uniref:Hypp41 protein n=1 Tax=Branchiostoma lanceolatum TaxID=7740 RepID=A0A8J9W168_BRALA|nr:Hypp41 [Branchiostoma lanceolatum]